MLCTFIWVMMMTIYDGVEEKIIYKNESYSTFEFLTLRIKSLVLNNYLFFCEMSWKIF